MIRTRKMTLPVSVEDTVAIVVLLRAGHSYATIEWMTGISRWRVERAALDAGWVPPARMGRAERLAQGLCGSCYEPRVPGSKIYCARHLRANRKRSAMRRLERERAGVCVQCGTAPAVTGRLHCAAHLEEQRLAAARRYHARDSE